MSEVFTYNTEEAVNQKPIQPQAQVLPLVAEDNPILKQVVPEFNFNNPPVNPTALASSLVETCKHYKGYGLSANQCGLSYRVFVMGSNEEYVAFFNPKIVSTSGECHMIEGCLSFPLLGLRITRPETIEVEYQDFNGVVRQAKYNGISARCFQHELDHMNGIVYTEKVKPMALQSGMNKRNKMIKKLRIR